MEWRSDYKQEQTRLCIVDYLISEEMAPFMSGGVRKIEEEGYVAEYCHACRLRLPDWLCHLIRLRLTALNLLPDPLMGIVASYLAGYMGTQIEI